MNNERMLDLDAFGEWLSRASFRPKDRSQDQSVSNNPVVEYTPIGAEAQTQTGFIQPPTVRTQDM
jgi:hypothetical protein